MTYPATIIERLAPNFSRHEFRCRGTNCCGGSAAIDLSLVRAVQAYRDAAKKPTRILSGFRCFTHNRSINSKDSSQHPKGLAADIALIDGWTVDQMLAIAESLGLFKGIGIYKWGIHVDMRTGEPARWDYRNVRSIDQE